MRFSAVTVLAVIFTAFCLCFLTACGGGVSNKTPDVAKIVLTPTTLSLNEGAVGAISAQALNSAGTFITADITFTSSNSTLAGVSTNGLVCGGQWDSSFINCTPTIGQGGVGQVIITATSGKATATATVYVHLQVDRVVVSLANSCTTMGQPISLSASAYSTSAPGCSQSAPCDITSTVGPFTYGSNDLDIAASSAGVEPTYSSATNSPTYSSGGTITGSKGETCDLSDFNGVSGTTGTVTLTGKDMIATGTQLNITNPGFGATIPPTTATLSNGTATCSGTANVVTALNSAVVLTAEIPGSTTIFATNSGVNSVSVPYLTCPVATILVHSATDSTTSFNLSAGGSQPLTADVYDTNSQYVKPALTWASSVNASVTVAPTGSVNNPATITAVAPGTVTITASCSSPDCNKNVPAQYSQNVVTATVSGTTSTTVYAASTNSLMLIPISTDTNSAGTALTLPNLPNSMVIDQAGQFLYFGSASGLMSFNIGTGVATSYPINGQIVAISPNGAYLMLSDSAANAVRYVNVTGPTVVYTSSNFTTSSSAYTPDSKFNEWLTGTELSYGLQTALSAMLPLSYTPNSLDILAGGGLTYISGPAAHQVEARSTCNQSLNQTFAANSPTLVAHLPSNSGAVIADSPAIDVVSTPTLLSAGCPVPNQSSIASYDLGAGAFTAQSIFASPDGSNAWIISDLPSLLNFNLNTLTPTVIPLTGGATPLSGGVRLDGQQIYLGTSDGTVHRIDVASLTDAAQIAVGLKDANGSTVTPNLVAVRPH